MLHSNNIKNKAIQLRKEGKTYSEILKCVPVAKSTLSLWLRDVGLSKSQKQRITEKKYNAQLRGGAARKTQRIEKTKKIYYDAERSVGKLSERELWLIGTALYWAEGTKEKPHRTSVGVEFTNSDPAMIQLIVEWLKVCCGIEESTIKYALYIHESAELDIVAKIAYWQDIVGFSEKQYKYTYYKRHNPKTVRKNKGTSYNGLLRVIVPRSTDLNRKIEGWTKGIAKTK